MSRDHSDDLFPPWPAGSLPVDFLLALTRLFAKVIPLDATSIIQLRSLVGAVGLASFMAVQKRGPRLRGLLIYAGVYGLGVLLGLHWIIFFHAMQVSSVAVGMLAMFTFPVITILLEPFFSARKLTAGDLVAGLVLIGGGMILSVAAYESLRQK